MGNHADLDADAERHFHGGVVTLRIAFGQVEKLAVGVDCEGISIHAPAWGATANLHKSKHLRLCKLENVSA